MAAKIKVYINAVQNAEVMERCVSISDIASVYCREKTVCAKVKAIRIYKFGENEKKRRVISILKIIELIETEYPELEIESIGENATLIELVSGDKHSAWSRLIKLLFVAGISFFGTGFTIMAYHNDIGINQLFETIYSQVMGYPSDGYGILEISYSIGLAAGIIIFFNHVGGRRITKDPTPIEVEMRIYENDVNKALIETADREGKTIDAS